MNKHILSIINKTKVTQIARKNNKNNFFMNKGLLGVVMCVPLLGKHICPYPLYLPYSISTQYNKDVTESRVPSG